jgi:hypothetical protein
MSTPVPPLYDLQSKADELSRNGFDIHTINLILNGQHGGWDVTIEATDDALEDHRWDLQMNIHGYDLQPAEVMA